jgi:hypothetical protein
MTQPLATTDRAAVANALSGEGLIFAARLIATNGLIAESAVARGDLAEAFARFRLVDSALQAAREIVAIAGRIAK